MFVNKVLYFKHFKEKTEKKNHAIKNEFEIHACRIFWKQQHIIILFYNKLK